MTDSPAAEGDGDDTPALRASDADRDAVLGVLGEALANGRLSPEEFDDRQTKALSARLLSELPVLTRDLPEGQELLSQYRRPEPRMPATGNRSGGPVVPAKSGSGELATSLAIMGGKELVVPPGTPKVTSYLLMGGDDIYLGDVMGPGVQLTVESWSMWAGNNIFVPPGVRVIDNTTNIMGGNDVAADARGDGSNGTLILSGLNLMAGNDVRLQREARQQLDE